MLAFDYAIETGSVRNPVGYFIKLTRSAKTNGLTIPPEAIVNAPPSAEKIEAEKARQRRADLWSDFTWLRCLVDWVSASLIFLNQFSIQYLF